MSYLKVVREREDWEKRDDARTLARAEEIKADKGRYRDAINAAKILAKENEAEMQAILKISKGSKKDMPFGTNRGRSNPATIAKLGIF